MYRLECREDDGQWIEEQKLEGHSDWVRDVAWAPSIGLPKSIIASCGTVDIICKNYHISSLSKILFVTFTVVWHVFDAPGLSRHHLDKRRSNEHVDAETAAQVQ